MDAQGATYGLAQGYFCMQTGVAGDGLDDPLHLLSLARPENLLDR